MNLLLTTADFFFISADPNCQLGCSNHWRLSFASFHLFFKTFVCSNKKQNLVTIIAGVSLIHLSLDSNCILIYPSSVNIMVKFMFCEFLENNLQNLTWQKFFECEDIHKWKTNRQSHGLKKTPDKQTNNRT